VGRHRVAEAAGQRVKIDAVTELVVGVDAGGTTTRCVVADLAGRHVGAGTGPGLNQHSSGGDAVERLQAAIGTALGQQPPSAVRQGVLAIAGAGEAGLATAQQAVDRVWLRLGLGGSGTVVPDVVATFAAGSAQEHGVALVAGTGAIAAAVDGLRITARADGYGWLLGDIGSAVWLGREAAVAVLAALDGRGPATGLTAPLLAALDAAAPQDVVRVVYASAPADLGRLAPLVTEHATAGDGVARDIVGRGVDGLLASADAVRRRAEGPTVLGGALLSAEGPVREGVLRGLDARDVTDVSTAPDATTGAVRLAIARSISSPTTSTRRR